MLLIMSTCSYRLPEFRTFLWDVLVENFASESFSNGLFYDSSPNC